MIVWLITGLWHGNGLNYLLWGAVLGLFIMLEKLFYGEGLKKLPVLRNLYVLFLIPLTWVIFAITDLHQLLIYFGRLFPVFGGTGIAVNTGDFLAGGLLCIPGVFDFLEMHRKNPLVIAGLLLIFWYSVYFMASSGENPFLYFQF